MASAWRVVTWNLRGSHRPDTRVVAEVLASFHADVVVLQEVRHRQAEQITRRLGWQFCWTRKHLPYGPVLRNLAEGLAIVSPHSVGGMRVEVLSPGVSTWSHRHRVLLAADVTRAGRLVRTYDVHLASHGRVDERIAQARRVAAVIRAERPTVAVVGGDFNAHAEQAVLDAFDGSGLRDAGGGPTCPSEHPILRLDYVLVPSSAAVESVDVADVAAGTELHRLSDHLPLIVEVRL